MCRVINIRLVRVRQQDGGDQTHQELADKESDEHSQEDAADEPEDSEGVKILDVGAAVLHRLLAGQLTPQFHGVVKAGQVLLEARAGGAAEVIRYPLPPRPLSDPPDVVLQGAPQVLAQARQRGGPPLGGGAVGAAAVQRNIGVVGGRSLGGRGGRQRL